LCVTQPRTCWHTLLKNLFPEAQVTIGPVVENGFYYDFSYHRPFTPDDLVALEKKMVELAKKDEPVVRSVLPRDEAVKFFKDQGEHSLKQKSSPAFLRMKTSHLYAEGKFTDLCRGPHVPSHR
jgi:threonyl-tRNA synthetase